MEYNGIKKREKSSVIFEGVVWTNIGDQYQAQQQTPTWNVGQMKMQQKLYKFKKCLYFLVCTYKSQDFGKLSIGCAVCETVWQRHLETLLEGVHLILRITQFKLNIR